MQTNLVKVSMAVILGIDPSISNTGLSVIDTSTFTIIFQATIKNPPNSSADYAMEPYEQIRGGIGAVIHEYKVEHAFIEQMFAGRNPTTFELLFCAAFVARQSCYDHGVPYQILPVNGAGKGWRWYVLGANYATYKGAEAKVANKSRLIGDLGQKISNEHQADATGIALAGWYFMTGEDFREKLGVEKPSYEKPTRERTNAPKPPRQRKAAAPRKRRTA
jgi:Holliday junction resolvasome RuvABC endonuclease subunit